jgi:hypothetical protein
MAGAAKPRWWLHSATRVSNKANPYHLRSELARTSAADHSDNAMVSMLTYATSCWHRGLFRASQIC